MAAPSPHTSLEPAAGFAARLRALSWPAHGEAERAGVLHSLIDGTGDLLLYRVLLGQLQFVYAELEAAADAMRADPVAAAFASPLLTRLPHLQADLSTLYGPDWADQISMLAETEDYVQRLRAVGYSSSAAFVAHHYTRYLGDLSGGAAVGTAVRRNLGLTPSSGCAFFTFDAIEDPPGFKANYRSLLDTAPWTPAEQDQLAAETLLAYRLNTYLHSAVQRAADEQGSR